MTDGRREKAEVSGMILGGKIWGLRVWLLRLKFDEDNNREQHTHKPDKDEQSGQKATSKNGEMGRGFDIRKISRESGGQADKKQAGKASRYKMTRTTRRDVRSKKNQIAI